MHLFIDPRTARLIDMALEEDELGFDVTSQVFFEGETATAELVAKQDLIVAGLEVVRAVFARVDAGIACVFHAKDSDALKKGDVLARLEGDAVSLLRGERTALNFLQRISGVATLTRAYVDALGTPDDPEQVQTRIVDTRKTLPGWRSLDKYAVRCGGGTNHRFNLASGVMLKDNHIAAAGGIRPAFERVRKEAPHTLRIEIEVTNLEELDQALETGAEIIMLDNMTTQQMADAIARVQKSGRRNQVFLEASGNITLERLPELRNLGLDFISSGALTHSAPAVDISMKML